MYCRMIAKIALVTDTRQQGGGAWCWRGTVTMCMAQCSQAFADGIDQRAGATKQLLTTGHFK